MDDEEEPIEVPYDQLPAQTLRAIAEDFCTRDGTDYADQEMPLPARVALLMQQLREGEAVIVFEARSQSLRIIEARALRRALQSRSDD